MTLAYSFFGPPGTGKSTTIIDTMAQCVEQGVSSHRIGLVSFTKAASQELASRAGIAPGGNATTIHSLAFRLAGLVREQVVQDTELRAFGKTIKIPITGGNPDEGEFAEVGDSYLALHAKLRAQKLYPHGLEQGFIESKIDGAMWQFVYFCEAYDKWREKNGLIDFTDMLILAMSALNPKIDVLFVDEAQDLSKIQWDLVYKWAGAMDRVYIAGDDDQSIYVWGGADPEGMVRFSTDFDAEVRVLTQSYRIPVVVHEMANRVIQHIQGPRMSKLYHPTTHQGVLQYHTSVWSLNAVLEANSDTLVLYRNHSLREEVEHFLMSKGVPYLIQTGKPGVLQSMYARAAITWDKICGEWKQHKSIITPHHKLKPLLTLAKPSIKRRIADGDLTGLAGKHWSKVINVPGPKAMYLRKIEDKYGALTVLPSIRLSTIHGSKGQEADNVVLLNGMTERTYEAMSTDPDSEVRTFYVGITRAKKRLDIVLAQNPVTFLEKT